MIKGRVDKFSKSRRCITTRNEIRGHVVTQERVINDDNKTDFIHVRSELKDKIKDKDFVSAGLGNEFGSPCWFTISMRRRRNNRTTEISMQIDRESAEKLLKNLTEIVKKLQA